MREYDRKLPPEDALDMRELYASGDYTIKELAEMYGIAPTTAWKILRGFSYHSITGGEPIELPEGKHTYKKVSLSGADHPMHILTEKEVLEIRHKIAKDGVHGMKLKMYKSLAHKYGVAEATVTSIATSATWKHLPSVKEMRGKL